MDPREIVREGYNKVSRAYRGDTFCPEEDRCYRDCVGFLDTRLAAGNRVLDLGCGCGIPVARDLSLRYQVVGVDLSPVQIERARALVPEAEFVCADMTHLSLPDNAFDAVVALYSIIHVPLAEQPALFARIGTWLKPEGWLVCVVGHRAWTGTEEDWLGVPGAKMYWSHADQQIYQGWLADLGFQVQRTSFIPEGSGGHTMLVAQRVADQQVEAPRRGSS